MFVGGSPGKVGHLPSLTAVSFRALQRTTNLKIRFIERVPELHRRS